MDAGRRSTFVLLTLVSDLVRQAQSPHRQHQCKYQYPVVVVSCLLTSIQPLVVVGHLRARHRASCPTVPTPFIYPLSDISRISPAEPASHSACKGHRSIGGKRSQCFGQRRRGPRLVGCRPRRRRRCGSSACGRLSRLAHRARACIGGAHERVCKPDRLFSQPQSEP